MNRVSFLSNSFVRTKKTLFLQSLIKTDHSVIFQYNEKDISAIKEKKK